MLNEERGKTKDGKNIIAVIVEGGIGDHLLATPMLRGIRKKYPPDQWYIAVMAMYHEIFGYLPRDSSTGQLLPTNPNIDVLFSMRMTSEFYEAWARNAKETHRQNPYLYSAQRFGTKHMAEVWCTLHDVEFDTLVLDYFVLPEEDRQAAALYSTIDNPVVVIHPFGGNDTIQDKNITHNKDWEIPKWQKVVDYLVNRGYEVIQIGAANEHIFNKVISFVGQTNVREAITIITKASMLIAVDSFAIHAAKALGIPSIVVWGRTNPYRVGYPEHFNIFKLHSCPEIFCGRPEGILFDTQPNNKYFMPWQCLHRNCMKAIHTHDVIKGVITLEKRLNLNPNTFVRQTYTGVPDNLCQADPSE